MSKARNKDHNKQSSYQLRIIGGAWRGRKLTFPPVEGLRPTPDRIRETLFNWLTAAIPGARCLDLFAGSGALGIEALSRGATHVDFVDSATAVINQLQQNFELLNTQNANAYQNNADSWLSNRDSEQPAYDIVFLDPPFHQQMLPHAINALENSGVLADNSWVYIETSKDEALPTLPFSWQLHREKTAGQVAYRLFNIDKQNEQS